MTIVRFTKFAESTAEEWKLIGDKFTVYEHGLVDRLLASLDRLKGGDLGYPVDRYEHSLQTASRAMRAGADDETVVCGLFHDIGDDLAPSNHGSLASEMLRPYVSPLNYWMVRNHEPFQGYYYNHFFGGDRFAREQHRGHPGFERTARFCDEWDQTAFDPNYDTMPLAAFRPAVERIFGRKPWGDHTKE